MASTTRKVITDEIWKKLETLVRQAKHSAAGSPPVQTDRDFIEAVLWIARTGSPWRDLPPQMGNWNHGYVRFRTWEKRGVWKRLWQFLQEEAFADARLLFIDSTCVHAHQHAAGAPKKNGGDQALGPSRGGLTTKIHAACMDETSSGGPVLSPGQSSDCSHFEQLFAGLNADNVLEAAALDKGYDTNAIRDCLAKDGIEPVIPPKSNRKDQIPYDAAVYRQRNRVERFFNRLKHFRRIATRYEKYACTFLAMVHLTAALLYLR